MDCGWTCGRFLLGLQLVFRRRCGILMDKRKQLVNDLLEWYPEHARDLPWRADREPYHVWLSEIMLQQTRVEAVKEYYKRFLQALPTIQSLAEADEEQLLKLWEGLGYYNRARNLQKAARMVMEKHQGVFPESYEEIHALTGIGDYTAGAIASICFELPTPAVDGNVLRVYTRVMENASNIDKASVRKAIRDELSEVYPSGGCGMLTQAFMELGATVCVPNGTPKCAECPLAHMCLAKAKGSWMNYPVRDEKKARRKEDKTVFVLQCGDCIAIRKRPQKGLLSGMWEFPNIDGKLTEQQAADVASAWQIAPEQLQLQTEYTHIFSHVEWRMRAYYINCRQRCPQFVWITAEDLEKQAAMPSAFRPFLDIWKKLREG